VLDDQSEFIFFDNFYLKCKTITNQELRQQWMQMGEEDATKFLSNVSLVL
jgi:hypothetical protein